MGTKGEQTKELILHKSYPIFAEKGFSAVTMKDICEACNLSRGGLYRHYGSTQQIFEDILKVLAKADNDLIRGSIEKGIAPKEILETVLDKLQREMMDSQRSLSYAIYEYSVNCDNRFMIQLNRTATEKWKLLLEYGMEQGEFLPVDAGQMIDMILYVYQGARMWSRVIPMEEKTVKNIIEKIRKDLEVQDDEI